MAPFASPIMEAVPKASYVAALKLARELALELCGRCGHGYHTDQVVQIERLLLDAGEKLPPDSAAARAVAKSIRERLDPGSYVRRSAWPRAGLHEALYHKQDIEVSQCEFALCELGLRIPVGRRIATLDLKDRRNNGIYFLRFSFADML